MSNFFGKVDAEWVDAAVELPPVDGSYLCQIGDGKIDILELVFGQWWGGPLSNLRRASRVVAWLRIGGPSDAIPRAKVRAAVDRLVAAAHLPDCECPTCDAIRAMCGELGVTPSEVTP